MATDASRTAKECVACAKLDLPGPFTSIEFNVFWLLFNRVCFGIACS